MRLILFFFYSFLSFSSFSIAANESIQIGGDFTLTDSNEKVFNSKELIGKDYLVFFGFTRCPSVCPLGVRTMTRVQKNLLKQKIPLEVVFITVDPTFDNFKTLNDFKAKHGNKFIALRGSVKDTDEVIKKFRGYYTTGSVSEMEHSTLIYLMNKKGNYISHYTSEQGADFITKDIQAKITP